MMKSFTAELKPLRCSASCRRIKKGVMTSLGSLFIDKANSVMWERIWLCLHTYEGWEKGERRGGEEEDKNQRDIDTR
jgi:hypothetical protein